MLPASAPYWLIRLKTHAHLENAPRARHLQRTLQWRATRVAPDSPALPVLPNGLQSIPVLAFEAGRNRLVTYFSDSRQLLLFDFASGWWIAPTSAQLSAPLERQFMAGAMLLAPGRRWLCVHGGYDFWTTYKVRCRADLVFRASVYRSPVSRSRRFTYYLTSTLCFGISPPLLKTTPRPVCAT